MKLVNMCVTDESPFWVVHSSAVAWRDDVLVLPAQATGGKSVLSAALTAAGFGYVSDEAIGVRPDGSLAGYPKPISLRPSSQSLLPELWSSPAAVIGDELLLRASALRPDAVSRATTARWIVFPSHQPGAAPQLVAIGRAEALVELTAHTLRFPERPAEALDTLVELVRDCQCFRMTAPDLASAVALLTDLAAA